MRLLKLALDRRHLLLGLENLVLRCGEVALGSGGPLLGGGELGADLLDLAAERAHLGLRRRERVLLLVDDALHRLDARALAVGRRSGLVPLRLGAGEQRPCGIELAVERRLVGLEPRDGALELCGALGVRRGRGADVGEGGLEGGDGGAGRVEVGLRCGEVGLRGREVGLDGGERRLEGRGGVGTGGGVRFEGRDGREVRRDVGLESGDARLAASRRFCVDGAVHELRLERRDRRQVCLDGAGEALNVALEPLNRLVALFERRLELLDGLGALARLRDLRLERSDRLVALGELGLRACERRLAVLDAELELRDVLRALVEVAAQVGDGVLKLDGRGALVLELVDARQVPRDLGFELADARLETLDDDGVRGLGGLQAVVEGDRGRVVVGRRRCGRRRRRRGLRRLEVPPRLVPLAHRLLRPPRVLLAAPDPLLECLPDLSRLAQRVVPLAPEPLPQLPARALLLPERIPLAPALGRALLGPLERALELVAARAERLGRAGRVGAQGDERLLERFGARLGCVERDAQGVELECGGLVLRRLRLGRRGGRRRRLCTSLVQLALELGDAPVALRDLRGQVLLLEAREALGEVVDLGVARVELVAALGEGGARDGDAALLRAGWDEGRRQELLMQSVRVRRERERRTRLAIRSTSPRLLALSSSHSSSHSSTLALKPSSSLGSGASASKPSHSSTRARRPSSSRGSGASARSASRSRTREASCDASCCGCDGGACGGRKLDVELAPYEGDEGGSGETSTPVDEVRADDDGVPDRPSGSAWRCCCCCWGGGGALRA